MSEVVDKKQTNKESSFPRMSAGYSNWKNYEASCHNWRRYKRYSDALVYDGRRTLGLWDTDRDWLCHKSTSTVDDRPSHLDDSQHICATTQLL